MLWSLEIQNMFYGLKLMWGPSYIPFLRLWEIIHFLPSPASTVFPHFLAYGHILPNSIVITSLILTLLTLSYEDTCNDIVSTWMIQGDLSIWRSLIPSSKYHLPWKVTYSEMWDCPWISLWGRYSAYQSSVSKYLNHTMVARLGEQACSSVASRMRNGTNLSGVILQILTF